MSLFCPLCREEYRESTRCHACRLDLRSRAEADRTPVTHIWKGWYQPTAERLAAALRKDDVPCRMIIHKDWPGFSIWTLFGMLRQKIVIDLFVLGADETQARRIVERELAGSVSGMTSGSDQGTGTEPR